MGSRDERRFGEWPNKPDAANPAIASLFHDGRQSRGVADTGRSAQAQVEMREGNFFTADARG